MSFFSRLFKRSGGSSRLSPADFIDQREAGAPVLDVRTPGEFTGGHLKGALNVDVMAPDFQQRINTLVKKGAIAPDQPVYLYCRSGNRSSKATGYLRKMGFDQAYNVGAYDALKAAGAATKKG